MEAQLEGEHAAGQGVMVSQSIMKGHQDFKTTLQSMKRLTNYVRQDNFSYSEGQKKTNLGIFKQLQTVKTFAISQDSHKLSRKVQTVRTVTSATTVININTVNIVTTLTIFTTVTSTPNPRGW